MRASGGAEVETHLCVDLCDRIVYCGHPRAFSKVRDLPDLAGVGLTSAGGLAFHDPGEAVTLGSVGAVRDDVLCKLVAFGVRHNPAWSRKRRGVAMLRAQGSRIGDRALSVLVAQKDVHPLYVRKVDAIRAGSRIAPYTPYINARRAVACQHLHCKIWLKRCFI